MLARGKLLGKALVVAGLLALLQLVGIPAASASVSAAPLSAAQPNGRVAALAVSGDTVYLGGSFTSVTDRSGVSRARDHLAAIDASSGDLLSWAPSANGEVYALAASGGTVYVGGAFTAVNGQGRSRLAAVSATTGALSGWAPSVSAAVRALAVSSTRVYAGGDFTSVNGTSRSRLAAFSLASGGLDGTWRPSAAGSVYAIEIGAGGGRVYVGGNFKKLNGSATWAYLAATNPTSGAVDTGFGAHPGFVIYSIASDADGVYAGGGGLGGHLAVWRSDGSLRWQVYQTDGGVQAVAVMAGEVYAGGHYSNYCVGNSGSGKPYNCDRPLSRSKLMSVVVSSGQVTGWNPSANSAHGVLSVAAVPALGRLVVGGDFTRVGRTARAHLALFG